MLKVWGRKSSSNVHALMWCIGEPALAYERIDAGFTHGLVDTPDAEKEREESISLLQLTADPLRGLSAAELGR
jgi:hypothetical protein